MDGWLSDGLDQPKYELEYSSDNGGNTQGMQTAHTKPIQGLVKLDPKPKPVPKKKLNKDVPDTFIIAYMSSHPNCMIKSEIYDESIQKVIDVAHDSIINQTQNGDAQLLQQFLM